MSSNHQSIRSTHNPEFLNHLVKMYVQAAKCVNAEVVQFEALQGVRLIRGGNVFAVCAGSCCMYSLNSEYPSIRTHIEYHEEVFNIFAKLAVN